MERHDEHVLVVALPDQAGTHRQIDGEVERQAEELVDQLLGAPLALLPRHRAQVVHDERHLGAVVHPLHRLVVHQHVAGAQHGVPGDHRGQRVA